MKRKGTKREFQCCLCKMCFRDTTLIRHSRAGSYGEGSLETHSWQEEEEAVQAARRCQDMEFT